MTQEIDIESRPARRARQRRGAAERARNYRARHRQGGIPLPRDCDSAIAEAIAFWLARESIAPGDAVMPLDDIIIVARRILTTRGGFDRTETTRALVRRISPRKEHTRSSFVPSIHTGPAK